MWVSEGCVAYADPALLPCLRCEMPPVAPKLLPLEDDGVVVVVMSHVGESAIAVAAVEAAAAAAATAARNTICVWLLARAEGVLSTAARAAADATAYIWSSVRTAPFPLIDGVDT